MLKFALGTYEEWVQLSLIGIKRGWVALAVMPVLMTPMARAQSCMTQAKMSTEDYAALSEAALGLATAVKAGDTARVETLSSADVAGNFAPTGFLVRSTADKIGNEPLHVTQVYELDGSKRMVNDPSVAEFVCPLVGTTSETDFAIPGLPPGIYGFAMVEAGGGPRPTLPLGTEGGVPGVSKAPDATNGGVRPWLLAFVLRRDAGVWKLAGFSAHARSAAGHEGGWYWTKARERAAAKENWAAWVLFGEAHDLLRPANFVTSTNLDKLLAEQRAVAPPELADGIGSANPMVLKGVGGAEYRFTAIAAEGSDDGQRLNLMLHVSADSVSDTAAAKAFNLAAAKALLDAHKELRQGFDGVWVFAEGPGHGPFATEMKIGEIP